MMMIDVVSLPRDVPACARRAYVTAAHLADAAGEVPRGMVGLQEALGLDDRRSVQRAVSLAERHGLLRREDRNVGGRHRIRRLFVVRRIEGGCRNCGKPGQVLCPTCKQGLRSDLVWRLEAVELAVRNLATHGEVKPASVAVAVRQPLFPQLDDEQDGQAVVPYLLAMGLLGPEWLRALAEVVGATRAAQMVRDLKPGTRRKDRSSPPTASE